MLQLMQQTVTCECAANIAHVFRVSQPREKKEVRVHFQTSATIAIVRAIAALGPLLEIMDGVCDAVHDVRRSK